MLPENVWCVISSNIIKCRFLYIVINEHSNVDTSLHRSVPSVKIKTLLLCLHWMVTIVHKQLPFLIRCLSKISSCFLSYTWFWTEQRLANKSLLPLPARSCPSKDTGSCLCSTLPPYRLRVVTGLVVIHKHRIQQLSPFFLCLTMRTPVG